LEEAMMNESIIVGLVIGAGVSIIGTLVGYLVRRREMNDLWAEEERTRKSDHRRELYERELRIVSDAVDALVQSVDTMEWYAYAAPDLSREARVELGREAYLVVGRANVRAVSLKDQELEELVRTLVDVYGDWDDLLDLDTGAAKVGKEEEFEQLRAEVRITGSKVIRRIREMLEAV